MTLEFRNIDVDPSSPVEAWGFEGLLAAVDRGEASDWSRIAAAVHRDPWGPVAGVLEEQVLPLAHDSGIAGAMKTMIRQQRHRAAESERAIVAGELTELVQDSGLTQEQFAKRLGTSRPRLSTYMSGAVVPAATIMVRARRIAEPVKHDSR